MKRLLVVVLLLTASTLAQTKPAHKPPASSRKELVDAIYMSYFVMRGATSEEMWSNLKVGAQELEQREPSDKAGELLAHFIAGEVARTSKQFVVAEEEFRKANSLDSSEALPFLGLAETALDQGNTDDALGSLYFANFLVPKSIRRGFQHLAFARIAELYERAGKFTQAVEAYKSAVSANPTWALGRSELANAYLRLNQPSAALPQAQEAMRLQPKGARNYLLMGEIQDELGKNTVALEAFQKGVELDPGNALMHYRLGLEYESSGAKTSALRSYTTAKMIAEKNKLYAELLPDINRAIARLNQ